MAGLTNLLGDSEDDSNNDERCSVSNNAKSVIPPTQLKKAWALKYGIGSNDAKNSANNETYSPSSGQIS